MLIKYLHFLMCRYVLKQFMYYTVYSTKNLDTNLVLKTWLMHAVLIGLYKSFVL